METRDTSSQAGGIKDPVRLYTVSSLDPNAIVYDENPSFAEMMLGYSPPTSLSLLVKTNKIEPNPRFFPNEVTDVEFTIQPKFNITSGTPDLQIGFKLLIILNDKDYAFNPLDD